MGCSVVLVSVVAWLQCQWWCQRCFGSLVTGAGKGVVAISAPSLDGSKELGASDDFDTCTMPFVFRNVAYY